MDSRESRHLNLCGEGFQALEWDHRLDSVRVDRSLRLVRRDRVNRRWTVCHRRQV